MSRSPLQSRSPQQMAAGAPANAPGSRIGSIGGIPVHASWTLLLVGGALALLVSNSLLPDFVPGLSSGVRATLGLAAAAAFIGSILVHELAHAFVARRVGLPVQGITLWLFGGAAFLPEPPRKPSHAFSIAIAGPLASLGLAAAGFGTAFALNAIGAPDAIVVVLGWLAFTNLVLGVFNLAPGLPLDGGRVVQALLWWKTGNSNRATVTAAKLGRVVGFALMALGVMRIAGGGGLGLWTVFVGWMLLGAARSEGEVAARNLAFDRVRVGDVMGATPPLVPDHLTITEFEAGLHGAKPYPVYPVQGFSGRIVGVFVPDQIRRIPDNLKGQVHLRQVMVPAEQLTWAQPGELLTEVFERARPAARDVVLVGTPDVQRGIIDASDFHTDALHPDGLQPDANFQGVVGLITPDIVRSFVHGGRAKAPQHA